VLFLTYSSLLLGLAPAPALAQQKAPLELADNPPDRHIVVPGDTLWGISALFLKQPYRWPEIWRLNKEEIKNPHWIYPGQIVILDRSGSQPRLKIAKPIEVHAEPHIYVEDVRNAIPSIPQHAIAPFLSEPLVVEAGQLDNAPRIVATQEDRVNIGAGNLAYVTGIKTKDSLWQVYRPGKELIDPENGQTLGVEAFYLGSARLIREGEPATIEIVKSTQEISRDDRLVLAPRPDIINFVPHAPGFDLKGRVVSVYGGVDEGGRHSIVTLSRGSLDGIEVGHVLALLRTGAEVENRFEDKPENYRLPDERYGLLFVFRVFDHVSYALVMNVTRPVVVGDTVVTP
jgi:hypothetical protein